MITTPAMGLKRWDQPNDIFSYTELSDNFALLDAHDHSSGKGVQIPTGGIANLAITTTKIANDAIDASKIATDAVTATKIPNASVADAKLASPNNPVWRTLLEVSPMYFNNVVGGTYVLGPIGTTTSGTAHTTAANAPRVFPFNPTHYAVAGKSTVMRVLAGLGVNAVAPAINFTFGLYPVSATGGSAGSGISTTLGTVVAGSTVLHTAPAANGTVSGISTEFAAPSAGNYALGVLTSGTIAVNSHTLMHAYLQIRHV